MWYFPRLPTWGFLTNHALVLLCIARDPGVRLRDIAASEQAGLRVRHVMLGAERGHQWLCPAQVRPGHGREEMVLDLVVQAAEDGVGAPGAEELAVPGIVAEEAELGENYRKERRVSQTPG